MKVLRAFLLGIREFRLLATWADPARRGALTGLDQAYDRGREMAHRITRRRYEP